METKDLLPRLQDLIKDLKSSLKKGVVSVEVTEKKLSIIKHLSHLENLIEEDNQWLVTSTLSSLNIELNELLVEEQVQEDSLPDYFQTFDTLAQDIRESLQLKIESTQSLFEEFLKYSKEDQIKFLKDPSNKNLIEFFIPFLSKLENHKEILVLILQDIYQNEIEYREPFLSVLRENFYMQGIAAKRSNDPLIIFELLSLQLPEIESIVMKRSKEKTLALASPGLFEYWGLLSKEARLELVKEDLTTIDQFYPIARGLALQAREENTAIWSIIIRLPIFPEIEQFLKEDPSLYDSCLEKWPNLFLKA